MKVCHTQFSKSLHCVVHYLLQASSATREHNPIQIKDANTKFD